MHSPYFPPQEKSMKKSVVLGACLAITVVAAGCEDRMITEPETTVVTNAGFNLQSSSVAAIQLDMSRVGLPEGARLTDQHVAELAARAINPGDYVCGPANTELTDWYLDSAYDIIDNEPSTFSLLYSNLLAHQVVMYEAIYFQSSDTPQYFGYDGEFTQVMEKTDKDIRRFWDIDSDAIELVGMHGSMLLDTERVAATYGYVFGLPAPLAAAYAQMVRDAVLESQTVNGGNHPLFSFNALAVSFVDGSGKIVMGDGTLAGYADLGFGDVAPQAVFAHEFAHHVQFQNNYFGDDYSSGWSVPEQTRYSELMADAMSAYYLTHKRGATMNQKRVEQFLEAFFQIGDCGFTSNGHHGTPNQRMAAAQWGFDLADQAHRQGHILSAQEVYELFLEAYPDIVAPDAI
jgi:hypothetical protein